MDSPGKTKFKSAML